MGWLSEVKASVDWDYAIKANRGLWNGVYKIIVNGVSQILKRTFFVNLLGPKQRQKAWILKQEKRQKRKAAAEGRAKS